MTIRALIGITIAVALGVHFGLKLHENPQRAKNSLKSILLCIIIFGVVCWVIYLLYLLGVYIISKMKAAGYDNLWIIIWIMLVIGMLLSATWGSKTITQNIKKETKEEAQKRREKLNKRTNIMFRCLVSLPLIILVWSLILLLITYLN